MQRLVTSNPSPGYVYRVAQKFANDGTGTRGNLGAVVRAILTDYEARSPVVAGNASYGKLKEPLMRLISVLRTFNASSSSGRYLGYRVTVCDAREVFATRRRFPMADEVMVTTMIYDHEARKHSYELLAKAFGLKSRT